MEGAVSCIHGNRPPCDLKHSKPVLGNEKRSIGYLLRHNEMPDYITKYQDNYKSIKDEVIKLN